jgi:hypothetical protein
MPDHTTTTDPLDAELRRIAQALVAEAPEVPVLPGSRDGQVEVDLLRPPRRPSRRRPVVAVGGVAAAVLALVAGVIATAHNGGEGGEGGADGEVTLAADAGLEPAPQRLLLDGGPSELLPDGEVVPLELAGLDPHGPPRFLPDGGHVVVGVHPVGEPVPEGFDELTDMTFGLAVVDAGGQAGVERAIEPSTLVGVTATEAILARQPIDERGRPSGPVSILTHDLATGDEHLVRRDVDFDPDRQAFSRTAVVGGDLVTVEASRRVEPTGAAGGVVTPGSQECTLRITGLATGDQTSQRLSLDCGTILGLQVAPDGSRAAVAYETTFDPIGSPPSWPEVRLAVIDLPSGAVGHDQQVGHAVDCSPGRPCPPGLRPRAYEGMAWTDATTLRLATDDLTDSLDDIAVDIVPLP